MRFTLSLLVAAVLGAGALSAAPAQPVYQPIHVVSDSQDCFIHARQAWTEAGYIYEVTFRKPDETRHMRVSFTSAHNFTHLYAGCGFILMDNNMTTEHPCCLVWRLGESKATEYSVDEGRPLNSLGKLSTSILCTENKCVNKACLHWNDGTLCAVTANSGEAAILGARVQFLYCPGRECGFRGAPFSTHELDVTITHSAWVIGVQPR